MSPPVSILKVDAVTAAPVSSDTADSSDVETDAQTEVQNPVSDESVTTAPAAVKTETAPATADSGIIVSAVVLSAAACAVSVTVAAGRREKIK